MGRRWAALLRLNESMSRQSGSSEVDPVSWTELKQCLSTGLVTPASSTDPADTERFAVV